MVDADESRSAMAPLEKHDAPARPKGCWTCKKRKIGCDRGLPSCHNCVGTGRVCGGYGVRLAWPDQPDGRRGRSRVPEHAASTFRGAPAPAPRPGACYARHFLNLALDDLEPSAADEPRRAAALQRLITPVPFRLPARVPGASFAAGGDESHLMAYYRDRLSRMVSTIDANNGFRDSLLPMALAPGTSASEGLQNVMFALAATHTYGRESALVYRAKAIKLLNSSFLGDKMDATRVRLAVCMLLCVHSVFDESVDSDETVDHWAMHLRGASGCFKQLYHKQLYHGLKGPPIEFDFLHTWFLYHEILGEFSQPLSCGPEGPVSIQLLRLSNHDTSTIIGSLGCSVEVFEIMSFVNGLRAADMRRASGSPPDSGYWERREQECILRARRMEGLVQVLSAGDEGSLPAADQKRVLLTAQLYAIATKIYLYSAAGFRSGGPGAASSAAAGLRKKPGLLRDALDVMARMEVCTSPWPVFVVACEAEGDEQRVRILDIVERMEAARRIGNILVLRRLIEYFWKRLSIDEDAPSSSAAAAAAAAAGAASAAAAPAGRNASSPLKWWDVISFEKEAPWFI